MNFQVSTEKSIGEFDSNDADTDKQNPYHGMLTLTIQSKGIMDNHGSTAVAAPIRGPGRPPLADSCLDDTSEVEDPVTFIKTVSFLKPQLISPVSFYSAVNRIAFNALAHNLLFKPFVHISEAI